MLMHDAGLAWLHFVFAFILVGALCAELFILRLPVDAQVARRLLRVDLFYGVSAILIILAGVARVLWGAKGWDYYNAQPFFWAKMLVLGAIGLISIFPTRAFIRWTKGFNADPQYVVAEAQIKSLRRYVMIEVHLIALLLLFASFMARGIGG